METTMNKTPRWNLNSLYASISSTEYKNDLCSYIKCMDSIDKMLENPQAQTQNDFNSWLETYLTRYNELMSLARTLSAFAYINYSTDTTNTDFLNNLDAIEKLNIRANQQELLFSRILFQNKEKLNAFYEHKTQYKEYKFLLDEKIEATKHQMSPKEEQLASDLNQTGGSAWGMLQEQIISNLQTEDGKTFNQIRNDAYSAEAKTRYESWKKEIQLLSQNRIALASSLNNLKGQTLTLNKKRNWKQAIDRSLFNCRLQKKSLDALISTIEKSLPLWRQYFNEKAQLLKKTNATVSTAQEGLAFYDLFAPLNSNEKEWTFDQAREYIIKEYSSFSKDMGSFAKNAFEQGWIDAEVRPGKVGGAYDEDFPKGHQSRILTNFTGTFSDVITLAHELGHAYHFFCLKGKPAFALDYPMTLAETASTFAETIVKQDMIAQTEGAEKIQILELDLQDTAQVLVDILCRFYFEQSVFEEREKTQLTADDFCRLMKEAQEKSYGCGLSNERHEYMWAIKSHYYSPELDFYNFPYAFGQLFATGLYAQSKIQGPSFADTYRQLLSYTVTNSCEEVCKKAGFDITTTDFWQSGIDIYAKEIAAFKQYVEKL